MTGSSMAIAIEVYFTNEYVIQQIETRSCFTELIDF